MSDYMKAFCGVAETPYGFADWGDYSTPVSAVVDHQKDFDESENQVEGIVFPEWDIDDAFRCMEAELRMDVQLRAHRKEEAWFGEFARLARLAMDAERTTGCTPIVFDAIEGLISRTKVRSRLRYAVVEMREDLNRCYDKGEVLTLEWVEDFIDDYRDYDLS